MMGARFLGQKGFSLVEIAIVLVVIGLIISGGLLGLSPVLQSNKVSQTNAQMDRIEQALVLYVIRNGCLPCPAVPSSSMSGLGADGSQNFDSTHPCGSGSACSSTQGIVPWVTLGLSKDEITDAFGSLIDYAPSASLSTSSTSMVRTPPASYPAGALSVKAVSDVGAATYQTQVGAYVLISHGLDGSGGYTPANGQQRRDPNSSGLQTCNTRTTTGLTACPNSGGYFVQNSAQGSSGTNGYFDDIVRFKTAPVIIQSCGSNACGNPA